MTEKEWLDCSDPRAVFAEIKQRPSFRKIRLAACGCCREIFWGDLKDRARKSVEVAERMADGEATEEEGLAAFHAANMFADPNSTSFLKEVAEFQELSSQDKEAFQWAAHEAGMACWPEPQLCVGSRGDFQRERLRAKVFREVFGNPFRSPSLKLNCLNSGTIQLAEHIYHERAFGDLPVLAEAMEKEGCTATDILEHFRENSFHVRGCWALDLILDKS